MQISKINKYNRKAKKIIMFISIISINFLILQFATRGIGFIISIGLLYGLINLGILTALIGIIYCFAGKVWIAGIICTLLCSVYSVVNQYVIEFHGSPLTIPEFANVGTAINVLSGYSLLSIKPLVFIALIAIFFAINIFLCMRLKKYEDKQDKNIQKFRFIRRFIIFSCGVLYVVAILSSTKLVQPIQKSWHFKEAVGKYGYPLYFLASGLQYEISAPAGYSEERVEEIPIDDYLGKSLEKNETPDIFLILNESFYDISLVTDLKTDVEYMGYFFDMENTITGYAVVPNIGGGTNNSEYELLTSNSTYLFQGITPFQTLDLSDSTSLVSNMKELGYYTIGMHPASAGNYSRNTGYASLGFDEIHFEEDFINKEYYGERKLVTDTCAYKYMTQWYENAKQKDIPVFSYLLTIQNHGDWVTNDSEKDTVHVENCSNSTNEEKINEYLSCVSLSVNAIYEVTEYFQEIERPIILCMVGDHAPSFIEEIADGNENDNNSILKRATPFMIWANFPIEERKDVMVSMNELGPLLLDTARVKMMPYYQYILELGKEVPVLTSYGSYVDSNGNIYSYTDDTKYSTKIQEYHFLEYDNLQKKRKEQWFSVE